MCVTCAGVGCLNFALLMKYKNLILLNSLSFFIYKKKNSHFNHPPRLNSPKFRQTCNELRLFAAKKDNNTTLSDAADLLLCFELVHGRTSSGMTGETVTHSISATWSETPESDRRSLKKQCRSATEASGALTV